MVQFVDYGNVETVLYECIVQMLTRFMDPLPCLAVHAILEGEEGEGIYMINPGINANKG